MDGVTYSTLRSFDKFIVKLTDPAVSKWPRYLKNVRKGEYTWTTDATYAKSFTRRTAEKHIKDLESGADKGWALYSGRWAAYWNEVGRKEE